MPIPPREIHADRPFLFVIKQQESALLIGRLIEIIV